MVEEVSEDYSGTVTYDTYGNIRAKTHSNAGENSSESYTYFYENSQWLDQLTKLSYTNSSGVTTTKTLSYDSVGNPTTYFNGRDTWNFTWQNGRELASAVMDGNPDIAVSNTYDVDGIRETKTVGDVTHTYTTLGGKVVREVYENYIIDYLYDDQGRPYKLIVDDNGTKYTGFYILNLQGDVIGIVDANGVEAVTYEYDAWGKQRDYGTAGNYGSVLYNHNALKYRGYYYDKDLGLYYLNSRYYDAEIGRFISADTIDLVLTSQTTLTDKNLYAYCDNNPVSRADDSGQIWIYAALGGGVAGGIIGALSYMSSHIMSGDEFSWGQFIGTTAVGVVNGAIGGVAGISNRFLKTGLIAVGGIISGLFTYVMLETENKDYKMSAAVAAGTISMIGTFAGTLIDTNSLSKGATVVANYAVTICTGVPAETTNTVMQQEVRRTYTTKSTSNDKMPFRNTYSGGGASRYVCAVY